MCNVKEMGLGICPNTKGFKVYSNGINLPKTSAFLSFFLMVWREKSIKIEREGATYF